MPAAARAATAAISRLSRSPCMKSRAGEQGAEHGDGQGAADLAAGVEHAAGGAGLGVGDAVEQHAP